MAWAGANPPPLPLPGRMAPDAAPAACAAVAVPPGCVDAEDEGAKFDLEEALAGVIDDLSALVLADPKNAQVNDSVEDAPQLATVPNGAHVGGGLSLADAGGGVSLADAKGPIANVMHRVKTEGQMTRSAVPESGAVPTQAVVQMKDAMTGGVPNFDIGRDDADMGVTADELGIASALLEASENDRLRLTQENTL